MGGPLLLGKCPRCKGPRKYTEEAAPSKKTWLTCPSPNCDSHPKKVRRQWAGN